MAISTVVILLLGNTPAGTSTHHAALWTEDRDVGAMAVGGRGGGRLSGHVGQVNYDCETLVSMPRFEIQPD